MTLGKCCEDTRSLLKYGIFTKPIHVEKLVNFLNQHTIVDYIISTDKRELYNCYNFDIGISYSFDYIIDIDKTSTELWYNYHPALLPFFRGNDVYSLAVSQQVKKWGVTLHRMTMEIDKGEIIKTKEFDLVSPPVSTNEIGSIAHYYLFQLFKETIEKLWEPTVWGTCDALEESIKIDILEEK